MTTNSCTRFTVAEHGAAYIRKDVTYVEQMSNSDRQTDKIIYRYDGTLVQEDFIWPQKKKSKQVKSGEHGSQVTAIDSVPYDSWPLVLSYEGFHRTEITFICAHLMEHQPEIQIRHLVGRFCMCVQSRLGRIYGPVKLLCTMPAQTLKENLFDKRVLICHVGHHENTSEKYGC